MAGKVCGVSRRSGGAGAFALLASRSSAPSGATPPSLCDRTEMSLNLIDAIDWDAMWAHQVALNARNYGGEDGWYERAAAAPLGTETSDYADQLLSRLEIRWTHSVLDIGCGNGAISAAIAKRARSVTALDSDPRMLAGITHRALSDGLSNIRFVHARWETVEIGHDLEAHDVVLASRFFPITHLRTFLRRMNEAARELCYLTWTVGGKEEDQVISRILGMEYHPPPEYGIIYNMLYTMDLHPRMEIFESKGTQTFQSLEEAVNDLSRGYRTAIAFAGKQAEIRSWITGSLREEGGRLQRPIVSRWALILVEKDER